MTDELASETADAAPSLPMPRTPRAPGTTNAPGGRWHSPTNADRHSKSYRIVLTDRARAAQEAAAKAKHGGNLSEAAAAALIAYAAALGLDVPNSKG